MHRVGRECGDANSDVLGAFGVGGAVADRLAGLGDDGLARANLEDFISAFDAERTAQDDCDFFELRRLRRFDPTAGRYHAGHAHLGVTRAHAAGVFFDPLRLVSRGGDDNGTFNQVGHV